LERKIDDYIGDAPLDICIEYVNWIEDSFPSLGTQSGILPALEMITKKFVNNDILKRDSRYLDLWFKYL